MWAVRHMNLNQVPSEKMMEGGTGTPWTYTSSVLREKEPVTLCSQIPERPTRLPFSCTGGMGLESLQGTGKIPMPGPPENPSHQDSGNSETLATELYLFGGFKCSLGVQVGLDME